MVSRKQIFKRKKIIVFGVEGKNNKTETIYFKHFVPFSDDYILKIVSCGCTDPKNMLSSIKQKRKAFDYKQTEDKTFLFIDIDCKSEKLKLVKNMQRNLPNDISIIISSPTFELWFLNHFVKSTKEYRSNEELIKALEKFIVNYEKDFDVFLMLEKMHDSAISNSFSQVVKNSNSFTEVYTLFKNNILKKN